MTEFILLLSKCDAKLKKMKEGEYYYRFHYKGFYNGQKISEVLLKSGNHLEFIPDEDYLLIVRFCSVVKGILRVNHIKSKKII